MRRTMSVLAVTAGLCVAGTAAAQPRPGGGGPGRPDGPDVRKLEAELDKLNAKLQELEARLAAQSRSANAPERGPMPKERGPGPKDGPGDRGPRGFGPGGRPMGRQDGDRPGMGIGGFRGPDGFGRPGPARPRGPGAGGSPDAVRRIDRIIGELEQLKRDLQSQRR